jgi:hypothetical protein
VKAHLDEIHVVVSFSATDVYMPKYVEKAMDEEDELIPASEFNLHDQFANYMLEMPEAMECTPFLGGDYDMQVTLREQFETDIKYAVEDVEKHVEAWNFDMAQTEAGVITWYEAIIETRDPMDLADMDIMI